MFRWSENLSVVSFVVKPLSKVFSKCLAESNVSQMVENLSVVSFVVKPLSKVFSKCLAESNVSQCLIAEVRVIYHITVKRQSYLGQNRLEKKVFLWHNTCYITV